MNPALRLLAVMGALSTVAGCILTDERTGDRADGVERGLLKRESLATRRIVTAPATLASAPAAPFRCEGMSIARAACICPTMLVWGAVEMAEELGVGFAEVFSGRQFCGCAYPWERFRLDVADWQTALETSALEDAKPLAAKSGAATALDRRIRLACEKDEWEVAARLCRAKLSKCSDDLELVREGTRLAWINWNSGDRVGAVIAMDAVVTTCTTIGGPCTKLSAELRNAFRVGSLPSRGTVEEAMCEAGTGQAICAAAEKAVAESKKAK